MMQGKFIRIDHEFGYFLEPEKYAPLLHIKDESSVTLKLSLIIENFLSVYIINIRKPGTERYVKDERYFLPKVDVCVALGLPISIANSVSELNRLRNKFAHKLDYELTTPDIDSFLKSIDEISKEDVNQNELYTSSIDSIFSNGINGLQLMKNIPFASSEREIRMRKIISGTYLLANKCAFHLINEMHGRGTLKTTRIDP
ncbi:hypothetical protein [Rahnella bonaserana]|jgi:hypothetical protein